MIHFEVHYIFQILTKAIISSHFTFIEILTTWTKLKHQFHS